MEKKKTAVLSVPNAIHDAQIWLCLEGFNELFKKYIPHSNNVFAKKTWQQEMSTSLIIYCFIKIKTLKQLASAASQVVIIDHQEVSHSLEFPPLNIKC